MAAGTRTPAKSKPTPKTRANGRSKTSKPTPKPPANGRSKIGGNGYDADAIQPLEGLTAVRKRPGMYIGGTGSQGLMHLVWELVDTAVAAAAAGIGLWPAAAAAGEGAPRAQATQMLTGLGYAPGAGAEPRAAADIQYIAKPTRGAIQRIVASAVSVDGASALDFLEGDGQPAQSVLGVT